MKIWSQKRGFINEEFNIGDERKELWSSSTKRGVGKAEFFVGKARPFEKKGGRAPKTKSDPGKVPRTGIPVTDRPECKTP